MQARDTVASGAHLNDEIDYAMIPNMDEEDNYYTLFNLPPSASNEDVNKAFKRLSRIYHPDRHVDPELKEKANLHFDKIRQAYEVLSNEEKRAIYDAVGQGGLEVTGWELAEVHHNRDEIRAQYERLQRLREEQLLRENVNPTGSLSVHLNATSLFVPSLGACFQDDDKEWPYAEVTQMAMSQSVEAPVTVHDRLTLGGGLVTANGVGHAALTAAWKRLISPMAWAQVETSLGEQPGLGLRLVRTFDKHTFGSVFAHAVFVDGQPLPGIVASITRQLDKRLTGSLTGKLGIQNSFVTNLTFDDAAHKRVIGVVTIGMPTYVSLTSLYLFNERESHLKLMLRYGPSIGVITELGWESKLSDYNRAGASFRLNWTRGTLMLKFK